MAEAKQDEKAEKAAAKTVKAVEYVGVADEAEITKAQWAAAGVEDQEKTVWEGKGTHVLESDLKPGALEILAKDTDRFKSVDVEA